VKQANKCQDCSHSYWDESPNDTGRRCYCRKVKNNKKKHRDVTQSARSGNAPKFCPLRLEEVCQN